MNSQNFLFQSASESSSKFLVKLGPKYYLINISDIAMFYIDDIVFVKLFNGSKYPIKNHSLNDIENFMDKNTFFRVSRQVIINLNAIDYLSQYKPGQFLINLSIPLLNTSKLILSQERSKEFKNIICAL